MPSAPVFVAVPRAMKGLAPMSGRLLHARGNAAPFRVKLAPSNHRNP
jgi:hypothetical protein